MDLPVGYVDGFGIEYTNGIIIPTDITATWQKSKSLQYVNGQHTSNHNSQTCHVNFRASVYVSAESRDSGKRPITFVAPDGREYFSIPAPFDDLLTSDAELVQFCENHLATIINGEP